MNPNILKDPVLSSLSGCLTKQRNPFINLVTFINKLERLNLAEVPHVKNNHQVTQKFYPYKIPLCVSLIGSER